MAELRWGTKRKCVECNSPFYDMQRTPIACPKCGAVHRPVALLKTDGRPPRKNRMRPPAPLQVEAVPDPAEAQADDPIAATEDEDAEIGDGADTDSADRADENDDMALEESDNER